MGTSSRNPGPPISLVPSWADDPAPPASDPTPPPDSPPRAPDLLEPGTFRGARTAWNRFSNGGGERDLRTALGRYVRDGTGGAGRAGARMTAARPAGARVLGFISDVARNGAAAALQRFNLTALAGLPAADVFTILVDVMCPPGGAVDEAIARQGMLQAIDDMAQAAEASFDSLTPAQLQEFFVSYIARTIEARILNDLASRSLGATDNVAALNAAERQLHDFILGQVRGVVAGEVAGAAGADEQAFRSAVDRVYETAFGLLEALLDE